MPAPVEIWIKDSATGVNRILEDDDLGGGGGGGDASAANQATLNALIDAIEYTEGATDAPAIAVPILIRTPSNGLQVPSNTYPAPVQQASIARTADSTSAALATDALMNNLTALVPKFAIIDAAVSGDNTLLAAVTAKKIRVVSVYLVASAAVTARFESGAAGTALSGQMQLAANGGFVLPFNPLGWFETASGVLLNLELSGAISVDGGFSYVEI